MPIDDWKKIAAFGALLIVLAIVRLDVALAIGGAALIVLILRNPDAIRHPFG